jgi:hypothetical protein
MWLDGKRQQPRRTIQIVARRRGTQAPVGPLAAAVYGLPTWINTAWADNSLRAGLPKPLSPWVPIHVGLEVRAQLIHALKGSD